MTSNDHGEVLGGSGGPAACPACSTDTTPGLRSRSPGQRQSPSRSLPGSPRDHPRGIYQLRLVSRSLAQLTNPATSGLLGLFLWDCLVPKA